MRLYFDETGCLISCVGTGYELPLTHAAPEDFNPILGAFLLDGEVFNYTAEQAAARRVKPTQFHAWDNRLMEWVDPRHPDDIQAAAASAARAERDRRLAASDWVTARAIDTGSPVPPAWVAYRQALRDVTQQAGFPHDITWPEEP